MDKEQLKQDVINQLAWDSRVDANKVKVTIKGSTAILEGTVPTFAQKFDAENITGAVIGVESVDNRLTVKFPGEHETPSDDEVKNSIERKLAMNGNVDESEIDVSVSAAVTTLSGTVTSFWQKMTAESQAASTRGVVSVVNKLAVVPTDAVDDEVIAKRVVSRIDQNTLVSMDNLDVKVENGKVTLSGTVPSYSTWRSAYDAALFTEGVRDVIDKTIISYAI